MTSPALLRMAERAALPITVRSGLNADGASIAITDIPAGGGYCLVTPDAAHATRAYFAIVRTLTESAPTSPECTGGAETAAADPAFSSPGDVL